MPKEISKEDAFDASLGSLRKSVDALNENVRKDISFKRSFFLSIVRWVGYTVGATLVVSLAVGVLAYAFSFARYIPILRDYVNGNTVKQMFGK